MIIETILALIFIFAVLVIFHEFGHFSAAKLVGIRVEEFALGFGPKLVRLFKRGDTEYTLHPFPIGGFVKLAGMEPGEEDIADGFQAQKLWKRALVIFAGPLFSFILAVLVFVLLGVYFGFPIGKLENRVGQVFPQTEAARIGLKAGDHILSIDGKKITDGSLMTKYIHENPGKRMGLVISRNGEVIKKTATPMWTIVYLNASWSFADSKQATADAVGSKPASRKNDIQKDDKLIAINGTVITSGEQMTQVINKTGINPVTLELKRNGKIVQVSDTPAIQQVKFAGNAWFFPGAIASQGSKEPTRGTDAWSSSVGLGDQLVSINGKKTKSAEQMMKVLGSLKPGKVDLVVRREDAEVPVTLNMSATDLSGIKSFEYYSTGLLGFQPLEKLVKSSLGDSVMKGLRGTGMMAMNLVHILTSKDIKDNVGGPIAIASMTHITVALGPYYVLLMLGNLSLSLAFINLIPIPVLDGGHLAILGLEAIRRRRLTMEQMQVVQMVGLAIVGMLIVLVFFSDITKIVGGNLPQ